LDDQTSIFNIGSKSSRFLCRAVYRHNGNVVLEQMSWNESRRSVVIVSALTPTRVKIRNNRLSNLAWTRLLPRLDVTGRNEASALSILNTVVALFIFAIVNTSNTKMAPHYITSSSKVDSSLRTTETALQQPAIAIFFSHTHVGNGDDSALKGTV
jgi:hypothetical protein